MNYTRPKLAINYMGDIMAKLPKWGKEAFIEIVNNQPEYYMPSSHFHAGTT